MISLDDLTNLDPKNIGNWPIIIKTLLILVLCAATLFAGYWFDTQNQIGELFKVQYKEKDLKESFKTKQLQAATLPKLKEQLERAQPPRVVILGSAEEEKK